MRNFLYLLSLSLCLAGDVSASGAAPPAPDSSLLQQLMKGRPGTVIVLDAASGKLIASWNLKLAARRLAAPGSTVKPFVLAELLRTGRLRPEQRLACRRPLLIAGRRLDCTHSAAVHDLDAANAIAYSCNSYFAAVAAHFSPQELVEMYRRIGFTSLTSLAPNEALGRISLPLDAGHLQLQALGDWGIEITPLELAWAYRNLALEKLQSPAPSLSPVFDGLEHSVQYGMAHDAMPTGITAAGKTGTAATRGSAQTHAFFAGYAPAARPEIVVMIYLENGRGAEAAALAAPIFTAYGKTARGAGK